MLSQLSYPPTPLDDLRTYQRLNRIVKNCQKWAKREGESKITMTRRVFYCSGEALGFLSFQGGYMFRNFSIVFVYLIAFNFLQTSVAEDLFGQCYPGKNIPWSVTVRGEGKDNVSGTVATERARKDLTARFSYCQRLCTKKNGFFSSEESKIPRPFCLTHEGGAAYDCFVQGQVNCQAQSSSQCKQHCFFNYNTCVSLSCHCHAPGCSTEGCKAACKSDQIKCENTCD